MRMAEGVLSLLPYGVFALLALTGWLAALSWPFYAGLAVAAFHAAWQTASADFVDPKNCLARFKSNRDFGLIVLAAIIAGQIT